MKRSGAPSPANGPSNGVGSFTRMGFNFKLYVAKHSLARDPPSDFSDRDGDANFTNPIVNSTEADLPTCRD